MYYRIIFNSRKTASGQTSLPPLLETCVVTSLAAISQQSMKIPSLNENAESQTAIYYTSTSTTV